MHVLITRMLKVFVEDTYGAARWDQVLGVAGLRRVEIDARLRHDADQSDRLMRAVEAEFRRPIGGVLEDVGTYLVSHPNAQSIRRLLRFCGVDFVDFLHSLEDLPDRVALVLPDLALPEIEVLGEGDGRFEILCRNALPGFSELIAGLVRAMADDFGVLALLEHVGGHGDCDRVRVTVIECDFAEGRDFLLGGADLAEGAA